MTTNISSERFVFDEAHYQQVVIDLVYDDAIKQLWNKLSYQGLLSHISTVFFVDATNNLSVKLGCDIEIHVGLPNLPLQSFMRKKGIKGIVGVTPKNPIDNPNPSPTQNSVYVRQFKSLLDSKNIDYTPAYGRARDFKEGGSGCFLLIDVSPEEAIDLLEADGEPTQLSITYLPEDGKAQLVSCIEKPKKEPRIKVVLRELTPEERALALSYLGALLGGCREYPYVDPSPRLTEFFYLVKLANPDTKVKLIGFIARLLANPSLL